MKAFFNRSILLIVFLLLSICAVTIPQESYGIVKNSDLDAIEENLENDPGLAALRLEKILRTFYRTAIPNEMTEVFPSPDNAPPGTMERPVRRKDQLLRSLSTAKQSPFFIKDAPNLFRAHRLLARAYFLQKNYLKAADHALNALRFRSLKLTPEVWADEKRMELAQDSEETKAKARELLKTKNDYEAALKEYNQLKEEKHREEDRMAQNGAGMDEINRLRSDYEQKILEAEKKVQTLQKSYEDQMVSFQEYEKKYNRESAQFLIETGEIFQAIDRQLMDKNKNANYPDQYTSSYNYSSTQNWQTAQKHIAYINLLELASRLDPENAKTPYKLGVQYTANGNRTRAIDSFLLALKYDESGAVKLSEEEKIDAYTKLGAHYHRSRMFVEAVYYYEKALEASEKPDFFLRYNVARIHTENTGNYAKALELLEPLSGELQDRFDSELDRLRAQYDIYSLYIIIYERTQKNEELIGYLEKARDLHLNLEKRIFDAKNELQGKYRELLQLKNRMAATRAREDIQNYYTALDEYRSLQTKVSDLTIVRNRMDLKKIYFTLAKEKEKERKIEEAMEAYRAAESFGIYPDEARRQMTRLSGKYNLNR